MSAMGHKQTSFKAPAMSALGRKVDVLNLIRSGNRTASSDAFRQAVTSLGMFCEIRLGQPLRRIVGRVGR